MNNNTISQDISQITKKRKIDTSDDLLGYEKKVEKKDHNLMFAENVAMFFATHDTDNQDCAVVHLDAENARTTLALAQKLKPAQMKKVCANTLTKKTYIKMRETLENAKIKCFIERENLKYKFHWSNNPDVGIAMLQ